MDTPLFSTAAKNPLFTVSTGSRVRREIRVCKHPGCGAKFEGSPTSLYCLDHRTRKSRAERFVPKEAPKPEESNLVLKEETAKPTLTHRHCSLEGCGRGYSFTLYPDRELYPMYCELHRTEFKRRHFTRMLEKGEKPRYEKPSWTKWSDYETDFESYSINQPLLTPFGQPKGKASGSHSAH